MVTSCCLLDGILGTLDRPPLRNARSLAKDETMEYPVFDAWGKPLLHPLGSMACFLDEVPLRSKTAVGIFFFVVGTDAGVRFVGIQS